jgi:hypothetical protein
MDSFGAYMRFCIAFDAALLGVGLIVYFVR